ncbi:AAA family ATPase, partial [Candidatus Saccharibacteria bacterium]|nr:AAA family ATPase [Candidatus Saccharibacteria bacterium]
MYIKSITLTNYRNFDSLDLALGKKATMLIGKNGAGKTNIISALKQSLSFIFSKNSRISQFSFVAETGEKVKSFETTDPMRTISHDGSQTQNGTWPIRIVTTVDIEENEPLRVVFERVSLSEGMKETYSSESIKFWKKYRDLIDLPVLAFYSDAFPHEKARVGKKIQDKLDSTFGISQPDAYYNWDDPRDCSNVWQQYYAMQFKNYKYNSGNGNEKDYLDAINDCLIRFSTRLDNAIGNDDFELMGLSLVARGKNEIVVIRFKNGMESDFDSLPAGYRRAFSMAFDLANRAFLLNKNCNPAGVSFVDEVELHLHPSLAQEIVERLQRTFPRMQFIFSTHSPLVLSNFKQDSEDNLVYRICRQDNFTSSVHRIDYS